MLFAAFMTLSVIGAVASRNCLEHLQEAELGPPVPGAWIPTCNQDGTYAPVQCHGAVCMCHDAEGEVIKGYTEVAIAASKHMTCRCAIDKDVYFKAGLIGEIHQCEANGNYSPIQCNGAVCYCVNENGVMRQHPKGVHVSDIDQLKC